MPNSSNAISQSFFGLARFSKITGYGLILGGLFCSVIAALWFTGDFIAASVTSPNLTGDAQVSDFNDFSYLGESLSGSRFGLGSLVLIMAIAVIVLGLLLLTREGKAHFLFLAGGVALAAEVIFLMKVFYLPVFIVFLLTACGLYLATEWSRLKRSISMADPEQENGFDQAEETFGEPLPDLVAVEPTTNPEPDAEPDYKSEFDTIPTLIDEIETEDLTDDPFAREAAYLSGQERDLVFAQNVETESEPVIAEPSKPERIEESSLQSREVPDFQSVLEQEAESSQPTKNKKRVWNALDWVISGLIFLTVVAIILVIIAR